MWFFTKPEFHLRDNNKIQNRHSTDGLFPLCYLLVEALREGNLRAKA